MRHRVQGVDDTTRTACCVFSQSTSKTKMLSLTVGALAMATQHGRSLSYTGILTYAPGSEVTDHASELCQHTHKRAASHACKARVAQQCKASALLPF